MFYAHNVKEVSSFVDAREDLCTIQPVFPAFEEIDRSGG